MHKLLAGMVALVLLLVIAIPGFIALLMRTPGERSDKMAGNADGVTINVYLHKEDTVRTMSLEEYVKGVLGAEMPAEFQMEALKAQAVAARTYAVKNMRSYGGNGVEGHSDADVSTDFTKSQAWLDEQSLRERWGKKYEQYWRKISQAVAATRGQIAAYKERPISAVFHSTSAGRTASAKEVWGNDFPYLQSVVCTWDQDSPRYKEEKTIAFAALEKALGQDAVPAAAMQGQSTEFAQVLSLTESGRVKEAKIGGKTFSGQELRSLLGLRSDQFTVRGGKQGLTFETLGYGHGVGLCQYGANGMAKQGKAYADILKYYYTGIDLKNIDTL